MARPAKPWYWTDRDGWYATVRGKRVRLADGKENRSEALKRLGLVLEMPETSDGSVPCPGDVPSVRMVADVFLDFVKDNRAPLTHQWYVDQLKWFCRSKGSLAMEDLRARDVTEWLATKTWGQNMRRAAIAAVKRLSRWARREGHIATDHLADLEKPSEVSRRTIPQTLDVARVLEEAGAQGQPFLDLIVTIWETGCRASEAYRVKASEVNLEAGTWTMKGKTTGRTGKDRVVYLGPRSLEICRRLCVEHPTGPIFRKQDGSEWRRQNASHHMRKVRKRLGIGPEMTQVGMRHLFVTDGLTNGVPIATVAELVGHVDTKMVSRVYSKLHQRQDHLRVEAAKIRGNVTTPDRDHTDPEA